MAVTNYEKRLTISRRPLQTSGGIEIVGSVPSLQVFQAEDGTYTPDYTLTPLVLFPRCNATDPDAYENSGGVNAELTNMSWHEIADGTRTLIQSTDAGYSIVTEGAEKGQIQVRKNSSPGHPITLEFYAEYVDPLRPGECYPFRFSFGIRCKDGTEATPVLSLDSPAGVDWNPLRESPQQSIRAALFLSGKEAPASDRRFFFYRLNEETGALSLITGDGDDDWEVVSVSDDTLTVDRDKMGVGVTYVVKASYGKGGSPSSTPDDSISYRTTSIRRRIPHLEAGWEGIPQQFPDGTVAVCPKPWVRDGTGVLDDPWDVLCADWYKASAPGSSYSLAVHDSVSPKIAFTDGMMLKLEVKDRGPYAVVVSGGSYVTSGGSFVLSRSASAYGIV